MGHNWKFFRRGDLIYLIEEVADLSTTGSNPESPIFKLRIEFVVFS